jgi:replicative DNA helicase
VAATLHRLPPPDLGPCIPPHSVEAEQAILGAVLVNEAVLQACAFLAPEDFYEPVHGRIFNAMRSTATVGARVDAITVGHLFDEDVALLQLGGGKYLAQLARAAESIVNAVEYARMVRDFARRRRLADAARAMAEKAEDRSSAADAAKIYAEAMPKLEAEAQDDTRAAGLTLAQVASDLTADLLDPVETFGTGLPDIDEAIGGVIPFGYLLGFQARPKHFKTGILHTIALNVARAGIPSCYFAAEMGRKRLAQRMLGHMGGFQSQWFRHRDERIVPVMGRIAPELPTSLVIEDCPGLTFGRLKQLASEHVTRRGCRVFFLDYYQLVAPDGRCDNRPQHLEDVAYWLQAFAYRHGVTWFVASQENRDGYTLGGDGLVRACDWHCRVHKHDEQFFHPTHGMVETLWLDVDYARDASGDPVGSAEHARLFIHPHGPHLASLER